MKYTGARIAASAPFSRMCASTRAFESKCAMPVSSSADATEPKTKYFPIPTSASTAVIPCSISASTPSP